MNLHSDMGSLEEFKLPDWLQRIFNGLFLGRRFDQKTVAGLADTRASGPELQVLWLQR